MNAGRHVSSSIIFTIKHLKQKSLVQPLRECLGKISGNSVSRLVLPLEVSFFMLAAVTAPVHAQVVIPSSATTVTLQTLSPGSDRFDAPTGTVVNTATGGAISGNNAQNWMLINAGAITGASAGITLQSLTGAGARIENYGSITSNGSGQGQFNGAVSLLNGGAVINHAGATVTAAVNSDAVAFTSTNPGLFTNDGMVNATAGSARTGVLYQGGGTFTQGVAGRVDAGYGVLVQGGVLDGSNAGVITGATQAGLAFAGTASGAFTNSGTISGNTGVIIVSNTSLTNNGTITGSGGTAISLTGSNNSLILGTGSVINGAVNSTGSGNALMLQGSGSHAGDLAVFSTATMMGANWTVGNVTVNAATPDALNVQTGTLTTTGILNTITPGSGITIAPGAQLNLGNGGTTGTSTAIRIVNNGVLAFNLSRFAQNSSTISGTGSVVQNGTGIMQLWFDNTYTGAPSSTPALCK